jgi:hypothetical protein
MLLRFARKIRKIRLTVKIRSDRLTPHQPSGTNPTPDLLSAVAHGVESPQTDRIHAESNASSGSLPAFGTFLFAVVCCSGFSRKAKAAFPDIPWQEATGW